MIGIFQRKRLIVSVIATMQHAPYATLWRNAAMQTKYGFTKLQTVFWNFELKAIQ